MKRACCTRSHVRSGWRARRGHSPSLMPRSGLAACRSPRGGGARTRLLWLDLAARDGGNAPAPRELLTLPSEIVAGAYAWDPAGDHVALLARSDGRTALCLLDIADGRFRSLADIVADGRPAPPFPPLTWRVGGEGGGSAYAYAAPPIDAARTTGWSLGGAPSARLFTADSSTKPDQQLDATEGESPGWRDDGLPGIE